MSNEQRVPLEITSKENLQYKKLIEISKGKSDYIFVEGWKLFQELVNSPLKIEKVYIDKKNQSLITNFKFEKIYMTNSLIEKAFTTENKPKGNDLVISIVKKPSWQLNDLLKNDLLKSKKNLILLEQIQDPGNLGTIMRSALAFNTGGIILTKDSADPYNTKTIRASAGAVFKIPIVKLKENIISFIHQIKKRKYSLVATSLNAKKSIEVIKDLNSQKVFLFGNEGSGLSKELLNISDEIISIPHSKKVESLNLATAVSILLWEAS